MHGGKHVVYRVVDTKIEPVIYTRLNDTLDVCYEDAWDGHSGPPRIGL